MTFSRHYISRSSSHFQRSVRRAGHLIMANSFLPYKIQTPPGLSKMKLKMKLDGAGDHAAATTTIITITAMAIKSSSANPSNPAEKSACALSVRVASCASSAPLSMLTPFETVL